MYAAPMGLGGKGKPKNKKRNVAGTVAEEADSKHMTKCRECSTKQLGSFVKFIGITEVSIMMNVDSRNTALELA